MMNVLKVFLQSVDEGLADIIDELEDSCTGDASADLKAAIIKFQQLSFQKREDLATEHKSTKLETNKNSFAWFDNFFGDVTTLLKNPLSPCRSPNKIVCKLPLAGELLEESSKNRSKLSKDHEESSLGDAGTAEIQVCRSDKAATLDHSGGQAWGRPKSQLDIESSWSNTKATSSGIKIKRPLDLQKSGLTFDDVFTQENFTVDDSSRI
jgi:hypothetical protein